MVRSTRQTVKQTAKTKRHVKPNDVNPLKSIDLDQCRTVTAYIDKTHPVVAYFLDFIAPIVFTVFLSIMAVHFQLHLAPVRARSSAVRH